MATLFAITETAILNMHNIKDINKTLSKAKVTGSNYV